MSSRVAAILLAAAFGWGLAGVGVRAAFAEGASTMSVVVVRTVVATLVLTAFAASRGRSVGRRAWIEGSAIGVLRIGVAPVLFIASLNYISAGFEGLVITLIPVVTAVMARVFLAERMLRRQVVGLVLGLVGTFLLIFSGETGIADGSGNTIVGGALALGGVLAGSSSAVLGRKFAPHHDTSTLAVPMFVSGAAVAVVAGVVARDIELVGLTAAAWWLMLGLAVGSTLLPFVATLYAFRHTTATRVSVTGYLAPFVAVVGGAVLLDEVVTTGILVGGMLVVGGVVLVSLPSRRPVLVSD